MAVVVLVSLPAEPRAPEFRAALLEACSAGLPEGGSCVLGGDEASANATLVWLDEDRLVAEVRVRAGDELRGRTLRFAPSDPEQERCRSIGFAIATLAPLAPGAAARIVPKASVPASPPKDRDHLALTFSPGGTMGSLGRWLFGAEARAALPVGTIELTAATGATLERSEGPTVDTSLAWVSLGLRRALWSSPRGRAFVRIEGLLEQLHVELYQQSAVRHEYRRIPGGRLAFDGEIPAFGRAFFTPSLGLGVRVGRAEVVADGTKITPLALLRGEVALGVGTRF